MDAVTDVDLAPVDFTFLLAEGLGAPQPADAWSVRALYFEEAISLPYEVVVDLAGRDEADVSGLLGCNAGVVFGRADGPERAVYGVVRRVDDHGYDRDRHRVRVYMVPAFRLAHQSVTSRVFEGMAVDEIVAEVLGGTLADYGRTFRAELSESYPVRDYCVQYRESDFDFVSRLLEAEGIAYAFEPDERAGAETLVVFDAGPRPDIEAAGAELVPTAALRTPDCEHISDYAWCRSEQVNTVTFATRDWKDPSSNLEGSATLPDVAIERHLDLHNVRRTYVDDAMGAGRGADPRLEETPRRQFELHANESARGHGHSDIVDMTAAKRMVPGEPLDPSDARPDAGYLVTRVVHTGDAPDASLEDDSTSEARYRNHFHCIRDDAQFRPRPTTPRPRIHGPQTAEVVGRGGDEIHTDEHGRIRVRFFWGADRAGDGRESCWVRVAQSLAGPGYGGWVLPRVGMEVVVEFLDGDPDQPLVTGCVYNGRNRPPYPLPDEATKSTFKSQSSPNAEGYNELRFEDAAGSEEVYFRAQNNMKHDVLNDHDRWVGDDERITVDRHRSLHVGGNHYARIDGDPKDLGGFFGTELLVTGHYRAVMSETSYVEAPKSITLKCEGSSITLQPNKIIIEAGGKAKIELDADVLAQSAAKSVVKLDSDIAAESSGKSHVRLDSNVTATSSGGSSVKLTTAIAVAAAEGAKVELGSDVVGTGTAITLSASPGAKLQLDADATLSGATTTCSGASGKAKLDATGATLTGPMIKTSATSVNEVSGGVVKIN